MKDMVSEEKERELSDRFDSSFRISQDETEKQVFQLYDQIRRDLYMYPVPPIDKHELSLKLASQFPRSHKISHFPLLWIGKRQWSKAAILLVLLISSFSFLAYHIKATDSVNRMAFHPITAGIKPTVSWLWNYRCRHGNQVTIPSDMDVELTLKDGSKVTCAAGSQLAFSIQSQRRITLLSGKITVHAAALPNSRMIVWTPLGDVEVVGTVFTVEIIQ